MRRYDILLLNHLQNEIGVNLLEMNETSQRIIKKYSVDPADYRDLNVFFDCDKYLYDTYDVSITKTNCRIFDFPKLLSDVFESSRYTHKDFPTFMSSFVSNRNIFFITDSKYFKKYVRENTALSEFVGEDIDKFFDDLLELDQLIRKALYNSYNIFYLENDIDESLK